MMNTKVRKLKLSKYEKLLEDNFEKAKSLPKRAKSTMIKKLHGAAKNYLQKKKRIAVEINADDLERIKMLADEEGLPFRVYISGVLHMLSSGRLKGLRSRFIS